MAKNVVFDEASAQRIADAVKWVEQYSLDETPTLTPDDPSFADRKIIRGTFTGTWAKGDTASVNFVADNGDSNQKDATNYFADVGESGVTSACCIVLAGSEWLLIAAEC